MTPAARFPDSIPATQRRGFGFSLAAAFVLNGLAIGAFTTAVTRWDAPSSVRVPIKSMTTFTVSQTIADSTAAALPRTTPTTDEPHTAPAPAAAAAAKETLSAPDETPAGETVVRFYRWSEVDRPAEPDSDWNLDTAVLDVVGIHKLVFEVFIDRDGQVVGCTILEPTVLDVPSRQAIEDRLRQTALRPAIRAGEAVASVRRIAVSVLSSTQ